jgi:hypothetical protein
MNLFLISCKDDNSRKIQFFNVSEWKGSSNVRFSHQCWYVVDVCQSSCWCAVRLNKFFRFFLIVFYLALSLNNVLVISVYAVWIDSCDTLGWNVAVTSALSKWGNFVFHLLSTHCSCLRYSVTHLASFLFRFEVSNYLVMVCMVIFQIFNDVLFLSVCLIHILNTRPHTHSFISIQWLNTTNNNIFFD